MAVPVPMLRWSAGFSISLGTYVEGCKEPPSIARACAQHLAQPNTLMKPAPFKPSSKLTRQPQDSGDLVRADALAFLKGLPDTVADIVFLNPPFNLAKTYV